MIERKVKFILRDDYGGKIRGKFRSNKEIMELKQEIERHFKYQV
jgi:hypothetical protein